MDHLQDLIFSIREKLSTKEYLELMNYIQTLYEDYQIVFSLKKKNPYLFLNESNINCSSTGIYSFQYQDENHNMISKRFIFSGKDGNMFRWKCIEKNHVNLQYMVSLNNKTNSVLLGDKTILLSFESMLFFQPLLSPCNTYCENCNRCAQSDHYIITINE